MSTDNAEWVGWFYVLSFFLAYLLVFSRKGKLGDIVQRPELPPWLIK